MSLCSFFISAESVKAAPLSILGGSPFASFRRVEKKNVTTFGVCSCVKKIVFCRSLTDHEKGCIIDSPTEGYILILIYPASAKPPYTLFHGLSRNCAAIGKKEFLARIFCGSATARLRTSPKNEQGTVEIFPGSK